MFNSRLFWKLFTVYALLTAIASVCTVSILGHRQRAIVYDQVQHRLHDSAVTVIHLLKRPFDTTGAPGVAESVKAIALQNNTRITLIAEDGTVVEDSEHDPQTMENHADRLELRRAKTHRTGTTRRTSPTLGIPMMYLAIRVGTEEDTSGYVRVSIPLDSVEAEVRSVQQLVIATSLAVSLVALAPMFLWLRRIIHPLTTLRAAADGIAAGDLQQTVDVARRDELGTLADAFNTMSRELSSRMAELNRTGQELRESSQLLSTVFGSMVEGVIAVDNDERILFANSAAKVMLDFGEHDPFGRPVWECVRNETVQTVVRHAMNGMERSVECKLPRNETIVDIHAAPLAGDPCPGVVLVFHDITELRRLENVRRDFVSNVSHELKTPLTIIQSATETLLSGAINDPEYAGRFLHRIDEQGKRLNELILDLLQLARIESGELAFELTAVPVRAVVDSLIDEFSSLAQSRAVALQIDAVDDNVVVEADGEALRTIIENLLSNALKYTPDGGQVTVSIRRDGAYGEIQVLDTGVGIASEHLSRIFERFYRADRARTREIGGTGLGLSIVKHLACVFSADVSVESEVGKGSKFTVRIPLSAISHISD